MLPLNYAHQQVRGVERGSPASGREGQVQRLVATVETVQQAGNRGNCKHVM